MGRVQNEDNWDSCLRPAGGSSWHCCVCQATPWRKQTLQTAQTGGICYRGRSPTAEQLYSNTTMNVTVDPNEDTEWYIFLPPTCVCILIEQE